jgi:diadenylate cyclase
MSEPLWQFVRQQWNSAIEILLLAVGIYYAYLYFRGTRGARVLTGLVLFLATLFVLSEALDLPVIRWLIGRYSVFLAVALVVIFQPELRRAFAELGSRPFFATNRQDKLTLDRICDCAFDLASKQCGALIAIERDIGLRSYAESGVDVDCAFSSEMMLTIFHPKTPLHDGGVIIRDDRIVAAACIFPVSQRETLDRAFGLRHRAALGLCEETDAAAIVVSEETGSVSVCFGHRIERGLSPGELRRRLGKILLYEKDDRQDGAPSRSSLEKGQDLDAA